MFGQIVSAIGEKKYLVRFDKGVEKECSSNSLRVKRIHEALPPDVIPPPPSTTCEEMECQKVSEDIADQDEEEALAFEAD